MMSELLRQIEAVKRQQRGHVESQFRELSERVVDGDIDPQEAVATLAVLGKTTADLTKAVEQYQARKELRTLVDELPEVERQPVAVGEEIDAEVARWKTEEERHLDLLKPLAAEKESLRSQRMQSHRMLTELGRTYTGPLRADLSAVYARATR